MATRVYIGRLPYGVRERDVEKFFKGYGKLREVLLKSDFGFVEFEDHRDADDAVYELNGKELLGERIVVEFARRSPRGPPDWRDERYRPPPRRPPPSSRDRYGPPTRTEYRLIVENLSSRCSWQDLKDYMRQAGEITYADAHKTRRNEGVVEFASYRDLKTAIEKLDGTEVNGRRIRLIEDRGRYRDRRKVEAEAEAQEVEEAEVVEAEAPEVGVVEAGAQEVEVEVGAEVVGVEALEVEVEVGAEVQGVNQDQEVGATVKIEEMAAGITLDRARDHLLVHVRKAP
ncbi:DgyrCDS11584 [Dimorphilus gyrociliatus]|uniref:DgyrCDS11584 n=1 Tax=Dimorphilus gyrociliatus TaxID=2664684 RepID=A0A7I8W3V0_9ANNE|nr:DgyrCDS11584 [Dimorphilus gyrociliatus]